MRKWILGIGVGVMCGWGQELTLERAVRLAAERYPQVRASSEEVAAAAAEIRLARTAYLPRVDGVAQLNRATRNNVFGLLFPQGVISPISGPPLASNSVTTVWGSAVGVLVSWEPFDFGRRKAGVRLAEAGQERTRAGLARTRLEVATLAADAYLTLLAAEQTRRAAGAAVERATVLQRLVDALVTAELRPGVESTRTRAEVAAAGTQVIAATQAVETARLALAQLTGLPLGEIVVTGELAGRALGERAPAGVALAEVPAVQEQQAAVEEARLRREVLERSYLPRVALQGTAYARGTGANADGTVGGVASGLGPNIHNMGLGVTVTFPALELPGLRARREAEAARERAEGARLETLQREVETRRLQAAVALRAAREIAASTPVQLEAARAAREQATARYQAGLGTQVEVADTQRLLTQAEIDDALARLGVWRAALAVAAAQGDVEGVARVGVRE